MAVYVSIGEDNSTKHTYMEIELVPCMVEAAVLLILECFCRLVLILSDQISDGVLEALEQLGVDISPPLFKFT